VRPQQTQQNAYIDQDTLEGDGAITNPVRLKSGPGGGVTGGGTTNTLAMFTGPNAIGDSLAREDLPFFGGIVLPCRLWIDADLGVNPVIDGTLGVVTSGVDLPSPPALDGGVQSFHRATYDCTLSQRQAFALYGTMESTRSLGAFALTGFGASVRSVGADINYSLYGAGGTLVQEDDAVLAGIAGAGVTIGAGVAAAPNQTILYTSLFVNNTQEVSLGNNVDGFFIPGSVVTNPQIGIGANGGFGTQLVLKNTVPGIQMAGILLGLDTTVEPAIRGGFLIGRGAGGGFTGNTSGIFIGTGPLVGLGATDTSLFAQIGGDLILSADAATFLIGARLNGAGLFTSRALQVGDPAVPANPRYRSDVGIGAPGAPGVNNGDEYTDATGVIGAIKFVWNAGGAVWVPYA
jgi:hypothetical protein